MNKIAIVLYFYDFGFDNTKSSGQPYLKPAESVARMKVADGFEVKLFAGEPDVVNPIAFTLDEKGRVWVVESFEYPRRTPRGRCRAIASSYLKTPMATASATR